MVHLDDFSVTSFLILFLTDCKSVPNSDSSRGPDRSVVYWPVNVEKFRCSCSSHPTRSRPGLGHSLPLPFSLLFLYKFVSRSLRNKKTAAVRLCLPRFTALMFPSKWRSNRSLLDATLVVFGDHICFSLQAILSQFQRLPGLKSSFAGLETLLGRDEEIDFGDYLGSTLTESALIYFIHTFIQIPSSSDARSSTCTPKSNCGWATS